MIYQAAKHEMKHICTEPSWIGSLERIVGPMQIGLIEQYMGSSQPSVATLNHPMQ